MSFIRTGSAGGRAMLAAMVMTTLLAAAPASSAEDSASAAVAKVAVVTDGQGSRIQVDGRDMMIYGMNWDCFPVGTNYTFDLWSQPDAIIEEMLARDMPLLREMGVNAIRLYVGVPPRWVRFMYERYGIYTILNHPMARYGFLLDGVWVASVDYADERLREAVKAEILAVVEEFRDTPGVLMWLLGNENNYGLTWTSAETEALPEGERDGARARKLYSLFNEVTKGVKALDPNRPVAIANGDVQYIDIIAEECTDIDVFGTNVYRGLSARDLFQVVKDKLGVPVLFTEFGADAFNAREMREDQETQCRYLVAQWEEIYEQSSGKGRVGNAVGGLVFQWTDGWWKYKQEERLDVHDTNASWPNAGYPEDYVAGANNMNEEWWGITAKGPTELNGLYKVYPRAAYYALKRAFSLPAYAPGTDIEAIRDHFRTISAAAAALEARGDRAALVAEQLSRVRLSGLRLEFETYSTGGTGITTPEASGGAGGAYPSFRGFDQMQSFYAALEAKPAENVTGTVTMNVLGSVPANPIDEIFYENRGRPVSVETGGTQALALEDIERVKVYQAGVSWDDTHFLLDGFYRTGHLHWAYEGDFFGLYREAYYGDNIDIYNGVAPVGLELTGKRQFSGLKLAMGPELWWGANPAVFLKYNRQIGSIAATGIYQEDIAEKSGAASSTAIPVPPTRKATLQLATRRGLFGLEVGGIWSGQTKVGDPFEVVDDTGDGTLLLQDEVKGSDAFGAKAKLTFQKGRWNWYGQAAYMGVVADAGPTTIPTFTGWTLKDSGSGNQANVLTGLAVNMGHFQVAPNFLYQKPLVGPLPFDPDGRFFARNVIDDPFAVRGNRETVGTELLFTFDPTPATWFWMWDNDVREDARFAASLGWTLRHLPTTQDGALYVSADGITFPFLSATPPRDLWEVRSRIVSRMSPTTRLVAHIYGGTAEPNGDDPRLLKRFGADARLAVESIAFETFVKINDFGPYDYHRDFNLTFPVQLMGDLSHTLGNPRWFNFAQTKLGVRGTWRSLDDFSPRYAPELGTTKSNEWEIRTYLHLGL